MIPRETIAHIADAAAEFQFFDDTTLDYLRGRWPGLYFTVCGDDDVPARLSPVLERPGFNVYLVNGSEHCLTLTNDPEVAIGVVLAWMDEE
ncbi:MAG: DUF6129 family protein [Thiobacillus sp.]|nr:DUF6129 family protein [Thiobacillus sp.]MDP2977366.1 DUF6129 family protein [Thiobacillus sp.]